MCIVIPGKIGRDVDTDIEQNGKICSLLKDRDSFMLLHYVEQRDGGYWISGTRVSLDSIVYAFLEGFSPESIVDNIETLTLEHVYGTIAYYLGNKAYIDVYLGCEYEWNGKLG